MKLNKIILFFLISLPASVIMRFLQLYFTTDIKTGFYKTESAGYGTVLLLLIFLFCAANFVFSRFVFNRPEHPPAGNVTLSVSSMALAISIFCEIFSGTRADSLVLWQYTTLNIFGIAAALYFVVFSVIPLVNLTLPPVFSCLPVMYILILIVCDFTTISKLALIPENIILLAVYCFLLLFFLHFAKLYNNTDNEKNFKNILSFGSTSVILCLTNSIPSITANTISGFEYSHISIFTNFTVLFFGLFISAFLSAHFSKRNLK